MILNFRRVVVSGLLLVLFFVSNGRRDADRGRGWGRREVGEQAESRVTRLEYFLNIICVKVSLKLAQIFGDF